MKKKLYVVFLITILMINILTINVNAALSFTTSMTPSSTKVEPGAEVNVFVKVSSLQVGDKGINTFSAQLGYDANVFEFVTETNIEGSNDWKASYYTGTGRITLTNTSFINSDEEIMQITLKVKSDVAEGTKGTVSLTNILSANPDDEISTSNVETTIIVGDESSSEPSPNTNSINPGTVVVNKIENKIENKVENNIRNNIANNSSVITPINNSVNSTNNSVNQIQQAEDDIPYTGTETEAFVKIIVGVIIIALLIYRKIYMLEDI